MLILVERRSPRRVKAVVHPSEENSIVQGGTGRVLRAGSQGRFETRRREVCSGSAGRLLGPGSSPQVHCSTLCPLSELGFAQESQRESRWSTHARTHPI